MVYYVLQSNLKAIKYYSITSSLISTLFILCDAKYAQIKPNMAKGMSNANVAKSIGVSIATLYNFLKEHPELREAKKGGK